MKLPSIQSTLMIGPQNVKAVPAEVMDAVELIEILQTDSGRSGFQIRFNAQRSGSASGNYSLLQNNLLNVGNRVKFLVSVQQQQTMLMDGLIVHQQLDPGSMRNEALITITGEDVSVVMDREEKILEYPAQNTLTIANKILKNYQKYDITPEIDSSLQADTPNPDDMVPIQYGTDLQYLQTLAAQHGFVFYVATGPTVGVNTAYLGPPKRKGRLQKALKINMGPFTNIETINFKYNPLTAINISGDIQDAKTNKVQRIQPDKTTRTFLSKDAKQPPLLRKMQIKNVSGLDYNQAKVRAQAMVDASRDNIVVVEGELDTNVYGGFLQARGLVALSGAGSSYDGQYYVKSVQHHLKRGEYKQKFTLTRDGIGTTIDKVES